MNLWLRHQNNTLHAWNFRHNHVKVGAISSQCWLYFDYKGVMHNEDTPRVQKINNYHFEVRKRVHSAAGRERARIFLSVDGILHQENAPADSSKLVQLRQRLYRPLKLKRRQHWRPFRKMSFSATSVSGNTGRNHFECCHQLSYKK